MQNLAFNPFGFLVDWLNFIPKFIYFLCVTLMSLIDVMQLGVRKIAGLDTYYVGDGQTAETGDIALAFIKSIFEKESRFPAIKNAFWALVILGIVFLIFTTIIAMIRQEYMPDSDSAKEKPSNNKMIIITRSVKSLFMFLIVPFAVLFGLMISDIVLLALDSVTTGGEAGGALFQIQDVREKLVGEPTHEGSDNISYIYYDIFFTIAPATNTTTFSGMMFKTAAFNANRVRKDDRYYELIQLQSGGVSNFGIFNRGGSRENIALLIDEAFANNVKLKNPEKLNLSVPVDSVNPAIFGADEQITRFSKYNVGLVWYYYDLWHFNFIVGFAFLVVCIKLFANIVIGLMKRIVEMVALFIISPPIIALMPLDGGKAFGKWRENFLSKAISAYGAIIGLNLFFLVLPYINMIKFFPEVERSIGYVNTATAISMINLIISSLFIIVGLVSVEGFIALLAGFIGGEDVAKIGGETLGKAGDTIAKAAKYTGAAAGFATAPLRFAGKVTGVNKLAANAVKGMSTGMKRLTMGRSKSARLDAEADQLWQREGAQKAHEEYLAKNTGYQADMTAAYNAAAAANPNLTYEDWRKSGAGQRASDAIIRARGLATLADYKAGRLNGPEHKEARKAREQLRQDVLNKGFKETLSKRDSLVSNLGGSLLDASGAKNLAAYSSVFTGDLKSAAQRNDKQGFKSMLLAFQGKTAKEIELEEIYKRVEDEERAKAKIQKAEREKNKKKS